MISEGSSQVLKDMAEDCAEINERDVLLINNQHNKNYSPLYSIDDVHNMMNYVHEYSVNKKIFVDDELSFKLIPSGHLLGSCQILLYLTVGNITKTILVTGDIGNKTIKNRFVGEYQQVEKCDYLIGESTYGDKPELKTGKKERKNDLEKFKSIIDTQIHDMNGRVIIPSFAQSRIQQLALMVYEMYNDSDWKPKVYIDGKETETVALKDAVTCVPITAGTHEVRFAYCPPGFKAGAAVSGASVIIFAAVWFIQEKYMKKKKITSDGAEENNA